MLPAHPSDFPRHSEEAQRAFFESVLALARQAEARLEKSARDYVIADTRIRFVFAGSVLEQMLTPALSHRLAAPQGEADFTIHVWDSEISGIEICPPPVGRHCLSDRGDIWGFDSRCIRSAFDRSDYSLSLLDLDGGQGVAWFPNARTIPYWTQASPFRTLFHWALGRRGVQLVHGAAIGNADGGVLITGRGGAGKSTTALACVAAGFDYAGDDHVVLTGGPEPKAHSLYCMARVNRDSAARFRRFDPDFSGTRPIAGEGKGVIDLSRLDETAGRLVDCLPIKAVLTPSFGDDATSRIEPIDPSLLLGAATFSSLAQLPHAGRDTVDFIAATLGRLPGYRLILGTDIDRVAHTIADLLAQPEMVPPISPAHDAAPLVSVIIPVHNGAHFIGEAVASILAQHHPKLDIIVVDDDSTDLLDTAIAALPVQIRVIRIRGGAPSIARNVGARAASGEFLTFLDVDDRWPPGALKALLSRLESRPEIGIAIGRGQTFDTRLEKEDFVGSPDESFPFSLGAALIRRCAFDAVGPFDPELRYGEDLDWFARARDLAVPLERLEMVTLHVRRHGANMTSDRSALELVPLRLARNALRRKRAVAGP